jgi:L-ascorbate metabolism protein UlaG (beta-lactamase superfamily)
MLLAAVGCGASEIEVTAVANEGFLVRAGDRGVLVDALFRATGPYPDFFQQGPSDELLERMLGAEGEFSRVDVVLVSHHHADHHDAPTAVEFLRRHKEAVLVGTEAVRASMAEQPGFDEIADRVIAPALAWGECADLEVNRVRVRVCRARHSGSPDLTNHVYRVALAGARFVHEGDAELSGSTFSELELSEHGLDLAFLHSWWVTSDEGRDAVLRWLRPHGIVLMHHRWQMAARAREQLAQLPPEVRQELPPLTVFSGEGERRVFEAGAGAHD